MSSEQDLFSHALEAQKQAISSSAALALLGFTCVAAGAGLEASVVISRNLNEFRASIIEMNPSPTSADKSVAQKRPAEVSASDWKEPLSVMGGAGLISLGTLMAYFAYEKREDQDPA